MPNSCQRDAAIVYKTGRGNRKIPEALTPSSDAALAISSLSISSNSETPSPAFSTASSSRVASAPLSVTCSRHRQQSESIYSLPSPTSRATSAAELPGRRCPRPAAGSVRLDDLFLPTGELVPNDREIRPTLRRPAPCSALLPAAMSISPRQQGLAKA